MEWLDAYSEIMTEPDLVALALPEDDDIDAVTVTRDSLHRRHVTPRGQSFRYVLGVYNNQLLVLGAYKFCDK